MTDEQGPRRTRIDLDPLGEASIPVEQAQRAALTVADHATGPDDARKLLDMLGLHDLLPRRPHSDRDDHGDRSRHCVPPRPGS